MKRILIIENDRTVALALTLGLNSAGYEVTRAYDSVTGVNAVVRNQPDLVLLDICLPDGNGFLVAEEIQSLAPTPIIFITASKQPGFRKKSNAQGTAGHLEKSCEVKQLLAMVQKALKPPVH